MRITNGRVFDPAAGFVARDVCFDGEQIAAESRGGEVYDASGCYVIPGLTDIHFHGCKGHDLSDGDAEGLAVMAEYELSRGVTQICPAGMTLLEEDLLRVCRNAAAHRRAGKPGAELCGVHLEGPFLSMAKKGAQNGAWLHAPDVAMYRRLAEAAEGLVKIVSLAPEEPGAMDFIRELGEEVVISLAHTTANYDTAAEALRLGARHVTHLFNAMPPFAHRDPGVVGAALDDPKTRVELICDGVHIHPAVVRAVFRMFGYERVVLISDTMRAAGMPDGEYTLGGQAVTVRGKLATLADGTIAGSATDLMGCLQTAVSFGIPLAQAVTAAAVNPAKDIGIFDRVGSLDVGKQANAVILDEDLRIRDVFFRGQRVAR
ncbi:MAG: N-acetylglucosamine-6-phosphate deacetylase [Oscillospiraceae bacterium]